MQPRRKLPREDQWGELYPFASHFLEQDDGQLHYVDELPGDQSTNELPTLLFVHGNPTWSFHWRKLILACREQFRCVAPDHRGCGFSDLQSRPLRLEDHIDNLVQLIDSLDLQRITLVAHDWGGAIGLGAALQCANRFERLVLTNTGAFKPWFIPWRIRVCRTPILGRLAVQGANAFSRAALRMTLSRRARLDPRIESAYLAPYHDWKHREAVYQFVRDIPLSSRHPTWKTLANIEANLPRFADWPKLLIWGMRDWCFTPECLEKFAEVWPAAEICRLDDVGHWVVEDAPEETEAALCRFLAQTGKTAASTSP